MSNNDFNVVISTQIYNSIFKHISNQYVTVFLCGGAYNKKKKSLRDRVKPILEQKTCYGRYIKIFYPEDLMNEVIEINKTIDLLQCECVLADNSDCIVIICESAGSLVELGAFVNNKDTYDKVIAGIFEKKKKDRSFINLGPIKHLKKEDIHNVFYYSDDESRTCMNIVGSIRHYILKNGFKYQLNIENIIGMHFYIQLLLYFFKELSSKDLARMIKPLINLKNDRFDIVFKSSINLLSKENKIFITKKNNNNSRKELQYYSLTHQGFSTIKDMLIRCHKIHECDKIRLIILYNQYYKVPQS